MIIDFKEGIFYVKLVGKLVDGFVLEVDVCFLDVIVLVVCYGCFIFMIVDIID